MASHPIETFILVSYNIDGLNPYEIENRTSEILGIILSENPDVVHLQEVVHETAPVISSSFKSNGYEMCGASLSQVANLGNYFTLTFVKSIYSKNIKVHRIQFSEEGRSLQGRDFLQTIFQFHGVEVMSLNCHLESTGTAFKSTESFVRMAQLSQAMSKLVAHNGPAFIAGDLNIRDSEAKKILEQHNNSSVSTATKHNKTVISDVAMTIEGSKPSNTWFMPIQNSSNMMKCRFDRIYANNKAGFRPTTYRLIGSDDLFSPKELASGRGCTYTTPSDHRGMVVTFEVACDPATVNHSNAIQSRTVSSGSYSSCWCSSISSPCASPPISSDSVYVADVITVQTSHQPQGLV